MLHFTRETARISQEIVVIKTGYTVCVISLLDDKTFLRTYIPLTVGILSATTCL